MGDALQWRYYEALGETKKAIKAIIAVSAANKRAAAALAKSLGASGFMRTFSSSIGGFCFDEPPDEKAWVKGRGDRAYYRPRLSTKAGKKLAAQMQSFILSDSSEVAKLIGMSVFSGVAIRSPGCEVCGNRVIVIVPEDVTPKGCRRISDLTYERLVIDAKARDRAASLAKKKKKSK